MQGANWGEAVLSMVQGHTMTPQQATVRIQNDWRRTMALLRYREAIGAALTIQAKCRNWILCQQYHKQELEWEREEELQKVWILGSWATLLQAVWRGRMGRVRAAKLRQMRRQSQSRLKRAFSWSKSCRKTRSTVARSSSSM